MTCPDWRSLRSRRDLDPEAWEIGLEHFDGCDRCRDRALAEEPTLMFRRLPAPGVGADEVAAMKQAVAVLRRSSERRSGQRRSEKAGRKLPAMLRAAAVAALVLGTAALQGTGRGSLPRDGAAVEPLADLGASSRPLGRFADERPFADANLSAASPAALSIEDLPLVEIIDPAYSSMVQVVDDEISLVLVLPNDV